jgi:hypothetical protein
MNAATRFCILAACFALCAGATVVANLSSAADAEIGRTAIRGNDLADGYRYATGEPDLNLKQFEAIIRRHGGLMMRCRHIEFGSVKMERGRAIVQLTFFTPGGQIQPFLYKLAPEKNSWKVESVQRLWFVPREHLLRGLRI